MASGVVLIASGSGKSAKICSARARARARCRFWLHFQTQMQSKQQFWLSFQTQMQSKRLPGPGNSRARTADFGLPGPGSCFDCIWVWEIRPKCAVLARARARARAHCRFWPISQTQIQSKQPQMPPNLFFRVLWWDYLHGAGEVGQKNHREHNYNTARLACNPAS